jgi:hypothetical protein
MRTTLIVALIAYAGLSVPAPLAAHHTGATIYSEDTITLKGTVKAWLWSNPHCLLTLDVTGEDGTVVEWLAELQAPNSIYPAGYRNNSFKPGDVVTVTLQPSADGRPHGRLSRVVFADGRTLGGRGGGAGAQ